MNKRTTTKLTASPNKPKRTFKTIQVRAEVLTLLAQVEAVFEEKYQVKPGHSVTVTNALNAYKDQIQAA